MGEFSDQQYHDLYRLAQARQAEVAQLRAERDQAIKQAEELVQMAVEAGVILAVLSLQIAEKPYLEITDDFQAQIVAAEKGMRQALTAYREQQGEQTL